MFWGGSAIRDIKQQGYALDRREHDSGTWSAAPVYDHNRLEIASLTIAARSVRTSGVKSRNLISRALDIAGKMPRDIGYEVPVIQKNSKAPGST